MITKQSITKKSKRSVAYPGLTLQKAIDRAQVFWDAEGKNIAPISSAIEHWKYGPKSSGGKLAVAALTHFGLLEATGSKEDRRVKITERAMQIILSPDEKIKAQAIKECAAMPRIYSDLLKKWNADNFPSNQTIKFYLIKEKDFNPNTVEAFIKDFTETIKFAKLSSSDTISLNIEGDDDTENGEKPKIIVGSVVQWESGGVLQFPQPRQVIRFSDNGKFVFVEGSPTGLPIEEIILSNATTVNAGGSPQSVTPVVQRGHAGFKQDVYTLGDEGQVILQWPEKMSQASYDEFVDWIDLQLRKIARLSNVKQKQKSTK